MACPAGLCIDSVCTNIPDAGPPPLGRACASNSDCLPSGFCVPETIGGQPTGFAGGSCLVSCQPYGCGAEVCVAEDLPAHPGTFCRPACTPGSCRAGYACQPRDGGASYCRPWCSERGIINTCPFGQTCDPLTGACLG